MSIVQYKYAKVILPLPFDDAFTYKYLPEQTINVGTIVRVPFASRKLIAVVQKIETQTDIQESKIKAIDFIFNEYIISAFDLKFAQWMANYTMIPIGLIIKMLISASEVFNQKTSPRKTVTIEPLQYDFKKNIYSNIQQQAINQLIDIIVKQQYKTVLLDGVTGSGKTEVYFEAIAKCIEMGQQALLLLPEISLTPQLLTRFQHRFGAKPIIWHSQLTPAQRRDIWKSIISGETNVVVGARSALMLPYYNLGLIIVDEEHDGSYKQEEKAIYNARDIAVAKGHHFNIPVILVSATPSLESYHNVAQNKYEKIVLENRYSNAHFPNVIVINMRTSNANKTKKWISEEARIEIINTFKKKEQSLLFLNRRGYAPLSLCVECGRRESCPNCTSWMVRHKAKDYLLCHYCDYFIKEPKQCPECQNENSYISLGPGVERIHEEIEQLLPDARTIIMSSDTFANPKELENAIIAIKQHEVDIIIGTQIMAKGHHFSKLNLVCVIDADIGIFGSDLRACEKNFQLLQQVAGRCGREIIKGESGKVFLQTYYPDHPVIEALQANDKQNFIHQEMLMRKNAQMPPYTKLVAIICASIDEKLVEQFIKYLRSQTPQAREVEIMGPIKAQIAILRKKHRWRLLLRCPKNYNIQEFIRIWLRQVKIPLKIHLQIDVDPMSFN